MKAKLYIDTAQVKKTLVALEIDGKRFEKVALGQGKSQTVLPLLAQVLAESHSQLTDINTIEVNTGPGSFTGLRVGVAVAGMLGMLLSVPVNGKPAGFELLPRYSQSKYDAK